MKLWNATCPRMRKKYKGSPFGISNRSSSWRDTCSDRMVRCARPFGHTSVIALLAVLTSWFRSFIAIMPTSSASGGGSSLLWGFDYWMRNPWCVETGRPQQIARTRWYNQWSVLEAAAHDVPQPIGSGASEREALGGFCDRAFSLAKLPPVSSMSSLWSKSSPAWWPFCWPSFGKGICVCWWYHCLCVSSFGHKGCEEGSCEVWADSIGQDQLW